MPKIPGTMHEHWSNIAKSYRDDSPKLGDYRPSIDALAGLYERVDGSHLRDGLFGHRSMFDLNIWQGRNVTYDDHTVQWMVIKPLADSTLEVRLTQYTRDHDWNRKIPAGDLISCFEKFLRQLG